MAEKQASYMMSSLKQPMKMTIHRYMMCMEALNGYLMYLPMLKDSTMAMASTEKGNKPFTKATHGNDHDNLPDCMEEPIHPDPQDRS
jgi:hypothetical protein